jgi:integrase
MPEHEQPAGLFDKVGECLYRYRSSGVYYARVKLHGKDIRRCLKTADRSVAKRLLADWKRELGSVDLDAGNVTVAELCERYLKTMLHQKPSTLEGKRLVLARMKEHWPGGPSRRVKDVRPSEIQEFLSAVAGGKSKSLYNHFLFVVRAVFEVALNDRLLVSSPAAGIKAVKRDKPIRRTPSFEEFQKIVEDIRKQTFNADCADSADFVELLGLAGLGQAEASSLTWADVNWKRSEITTFRHKTSTGFVIPIYPQLRFLLERLKGEHQHSPEDRVVKIHDAKKALAGACRRLNLPAYSQRALRRMFITRALEKGVDVKVIAQWQGHTDGGKLILDTYSHISPQHAKRMAQLMS